MGWIHENFILPVMEPNRYRGLGGRMRELKRFEKLTETQQRTKQAELVAAMLRHAYDTVPFYTQLFDEAGFHPSRWKAGDAIPTPMINRETIRSQGQRLLSSRVNVAELHQATTGGTTSTPVRIYRDKETLQKRAALQFHLDALCDFRQGDSVLQIWGADRDFDPNPSWKWRFYERVLMRRIPARAGQVSDAILQGFLDRLNRYKPKVLYGYGATIARLARYIQEKNAKHHNPKVLISTAEGISDTERALMQTVFQCPVTEQYGSREAGMIAWECEAHTGLHFHPTGCLVELEPYGNSPDGPLHRVIVTDLLNYAMPLIRYDTGDCIVPATEKCSCGRWYPKIRAILGRTADAFIMADGTEIPGLNFANRIILALNNDFHSITQLQVTQTDYSRLDVRYVTHGDPAATEAELQWVREAIAKAFHLPMECTFLPVDDIPRSASGKMRICISLVPRPGEKPNA